MKNTNSTKRTLTTNAKLLKDSVSKYAWFGLTIALLSIVAATLAVCYTQEGAITLAGLIRAQQSNAAIWALDATPFLFVFWGQYVSNMIAMEASAMVVDQTSELRMQTSALEEQVMHDMTHDGLTELPNRALFIDRLSQGLTIQRDNNHQLAVLSISIFQLKEINKSLGRYNGDRILKQVAVRLQGVLQKPSTIAHTGEYQFGAILPNIYSREDAIKIVNKIQEAFSTSFTLEDLNLRIHPNIGLVLSPEHGIDSDTLLQRAVVAMEVAHDKAVDYLLYSTKLDKNSQRHLILMNELQKAIDNDELTLYFQPKINLRSDQISAEALLRWEHNHYGFMKPDEFVPAAEKAGLLKPLTNWVITNALKQCAEWNKAGMTIPISLNISATDLMNVELPDKIAGQLAYFEIPHDLLILEVTEGSMMRDQERSLRMLNKLSATGIQISIDDFGTGYSSLAYLSRLPAKELKIDKEFVLNMRKEKRDHIIVKATIDLGHNLGLNVVAEGVETEATFNELKKLKCDMVQGYYISKPLSKEKFSQWVKSRTMGKLVVDYASSS